MAIASRALLRIREEMTERHLSQRDLASALKCSQGRIAKLLNGGVNLRVDDLARLAEAVGISLVEAMRDRGMEFYAELTPMEVRVLERYRRQPEDLQAAVRRILGLPLERPATSAPASVKGTKKRAGRPIESKRPKPPSGTTTAL